MNWTLLGGSLVAILALAGIAAWLKLGGACLPWSFDGYGPVSRLPEAPVSVLTPHATLAALAAGYTPNIHSSATRD